VIDQGKRRCRPLTNDVTATAHFEQLARRMLASKQLPHGAARPVRSLMSDAHPAAETARPAQTSPEHPVRRCLLLLNPHSRSAADAEPTLTGELARRGIDLVGDGPQPPEKLSELLGDGGGAALDRILVAGGDGTLNAVLDGLIAAAIPVAVLPLGTANDLAHNLGVPTDPAAAVRIALEGPVRSVDVARVNGRLFINVATLGLGPKVTRHLTKELKARLGFLGYPRALISAYRDSRPFHVSITASGGQSMRLNCLHLAVGNGHYYGGGAVVSHHARLDDGRLHLLAVRPRPFWRLLLQAPMVMFGLHRAAPDSVSFDATWIRLQTRHPKHISADGEILSETPAHFEIHSGALSMVVPPDNPGSGIAGA